MTELADLIDDLEAEHSALDAVLDALAAADWARETPAPGWAIRDQVHHLTFFDRAATRAILDPEGYEADARAMLAQAGGWELDGAALPDGPTMLAAWRVGCGALTAALRTVEPARRLPWYGNRMGAMSFVSARLMECWCHGQDIRDALGLAPSVSPRLRHVADIGIRALPSAFRTHGRPVPADAIRVELRGADGESWVWGEAGAAGGGVRGSALELCLVVTQRRHVRDTALEADGPVAVEWLEVAQAFAGPPGEGRRPGQFPLETRGASL